MGTTTPKGSDGGDRTGRRKAPFIVFEGIEGCGKSTQIRILAARLAAVGRPVCITREPGGTRLGESLRGILLAPATGEIDGLIELFLLAASRRSLVREVIEPARGRGEVVLSDRYADSSVAYQGGGRELGADLIERINDLATGGLRADLTFLLDLDPETGIRRIAGRGRATDRLEREQLGFHERVRAAYLQLAQRRGAAYRVIDATASAEEIAAQVAVFLHPLLGDLPPAPDE